jgi:hypothetical protein
VMPRRASSSIQGAKGLEQATSAKRPAQVGRGERRQPEP